MFDRHMPSNAESELWSLFFLLFSFNTIAYISKNRIENIHVGDSVGTAR